MKKVKSGSTIIIIAIILLLHFFILQPIDGYSSKTNIVNFTENEISDNGFEPNKQLEQNNMLSNEYVWGQPNQINIPNLDRGDYVGGRDSKGTFHCIFIKHLSIYGVGLNYFFAENNQTNNWTLPAQINQFDADVSDLQLQIDNEDVLHLMFISRRESMWQINYLNKSASQTTWSSITTISKEQYNEISSLTSIITQNNIVHLAWIVKMEGTSGLTRNSSAYFATRDSTLNTWSTPSQLYNSLNPLKIGLAVLESNRIQAALSKWDSAIQGNELYLASSTNYGETWSSETYFDDYTNIIGEIKIIPSKITGGYHLIWNAEQSPKRILYLELYENRTVRTAEEIINNSFLDGYFAGLYENSTNGNIDLIYEEIDASGSDLFIKRRSGTTLTWGSEQEITDDSHSIDPVFVTAQEENSSSLGQLFYLSYQSLITIQVNNTNDYSEPLMVLETTRSNGKGNLVIDSQKTIHYIWQHVGIYNTHIYYQYKPENETWHQSGVITDSSFISAISPRTVIDSLDNLHCFFIANDILSGFNGVFYTSKNFNQDNWSDPILVEMPQHYAQPENYDVIIDNVDTIHVIWCEQTAIYQNVVYYSFKLNHESVFTTTTIHQNTDITSDYNPSLVIDSYSTLHLVYTELDRSFPINYVKYRSKQIGLNWTGSISVAISTVDLYFRPLLTVDSSDTLRMVYLKEYYNGAFLVADSVLWQKHRFGSWTENETIFTSEKTNFHEFIITEDDTLVYCQHISDLPIDDFPDIDFDFVTVTSTDLKNDWTEREIIFLNPLYQHEPRGIYDNNTKNVYLVINDKIGAYSNIHIISRQNDTDNDLLGDKDEDYFGTDPFLQDSDYDQILDGYEVNFYQTNPALNDTDWDELDDGLEILTYKSNPLVIDTDQDTINDGHEVYLWGTDPTKTDSDSDGINDFDEIFIFNTNPLSMDTDGDNMPDLWELTYDLDPNVDDGFLDADQDGLYNFEEFWSYTNPILNDTDTDGLLDGEEVKTWGTNPLSIDTDDDTISDYDEVMIYKTNPLLSDSDGDGFDDREEINAGTDPNDARDNSKRRKIQRILLSTVLPVVIIASIYSTFEVRYRVRMKKIDEVEKEERVLEKQKLDAIMGDNEDTST